MIPRRAIFCWSGDKPMSWLRQQSIESFRTMNPGWDVEIVSESWPEGMGFRYDILRSDYARYKVLHELGGIYFDTDIVFVKPIPESWLEHQLLAPLDYTRTVAHIACLGGAPGHGFWGMVAERCRMRHNHKVPLDCQAFGTKLLRRVMMPVDMHSIKPESFLTHPWDSVEEMWADLPFKIGDWVIGLHWYGGDRLSQDMEPLFGSDSRPDCIVSEALKIAMGS